MLPGSTASYTVSTGSVNGTFTGTIAFSVSGAPSGATATFSPASAGVSVTRTLEVATKNNTPGGTYTLTITGTSGSTVRSATRGAK